MATVMALLSRRWWDIETRSTDVGMLKKWHVLTVFMTVTKHVFGLLVSTSQVFFLPITALESNITASVPYNILLDRLG